MNLSAKTVVSLFLLIIFTGVCAEFFDIAWGTGNWLGEIALTWGVLFVVFSLAALVFFAIGLYVIWNDTRFGSFSNTMIAFRKRIAWRRWLCAVIVFTFPIWFLQFTVLGIVFQGIYFRLFLWTIQLFLLGWLATSNDALLIEWRVFLFNIVLTASAFSIFASLRYVANYPFSLGWSEGNRLWDYSILFGRKRYDYPTDASIYILLDIGRQFVGGVPFLFPNLSIAMERLWVGLTNILPYILLGFISFRDLKGARYQWLAAALWCLLFLKQGPIHPPLIICAVLVAFAWKQRLWVSIPIVILASIFASVSRYTWTFAPVMWFFTLEFLSMSVFDNGNFADRTRKIVPLAIAGVAGAIVLVIAFQYFLSAEYSLSRLAPSTIAETIARQPLLWYRLFPNETYGNGILWGLFWAVSPIVCLLVYLVVSKKWSIHLWQKSALFFSLLAFLLVGLIVSVKIGGGGDLHNMDMFLIGLFFAGVLACRQIGMDWVENSQQDPFWIKIVLIVMIAAPALGSLKEMRSYQYSSLASWLVALADARNEKSLEMYPTNAVVDGSLRVIQSEVDAARKNGEILFMDQRQLITFGYITNIPLVVDYDKKVLIEFALTANHDYFNKFYSDLENKRFSLILSQPLSISKQGTEYGFGEENNAWVKWVAKPLLCYYDIKQTLLDVNVQLLIPKLHPLNCEKLLP